MAAAARAAAPDNSFTDPGSSKTAAARAAVCRMLASMRVCIPDLVVHLDPMVPTVCRLAPPLPCELTSVVASFCTATGAL